MKTLDRPLDEDDRAFADFADIRDWTAIHDLAKQLAVTLQPAMHR